MPLRSPKMYFCILGFQRFVWWPKCTPASSSSFMVSAAISFSSSVGLRSGAARSAPCTPLRRMPQGPKLAIVRFKLANCSISALASPLIHSGLASRLRRSARTATPAGSTQLSPRGCAVQLAGRAASQLELRSVLAVDPDVLLAEIRCPHPVLTAAETQVYADRILGLRHERADLVEPRARLEHALLHQRFVAYADRNLVLRHAGRRLAQRHHDPAPVGVGAVDRGLAERRVRDR